MSLYVTLTLSGSCLDAPSICWYLHYVDWIFLCRSGRYLLSGDTEGVVSVWDTQTAPPDVDEDLLQPQLRFQAHWDCTNGIRYDGWKNLAHSMMTISMHSVEWVFKKMEANAFKLSGSWYILQPSRNVTATNVKNPDGESSYCTSVQTKHQLWIGDEFRSFNHGKCLLLFSRLIVLLCFTVWVVIRTKARETQTNHPKYFG